MKRYGNLYHKIWDLDNIKIAHKNARKGKMHYQEVQIINKNEEKYILIIQEMLKNKTFKNSKYEMFIKNDNGKEREIYKLPYFPDRIIHHCIMQVIEPIWTKSLILDTYSSIKERGIHKGVKKIKKALKDKENTKYCLKMDVKKFYPSINHKILKLIIRQKIKDKDVLWLLDEIIDSTNGVPIGNYLSQYFGNLYLSGLDHYIKEQKQCKYYFRYCDDMVILHSNKKFLSNLRENIQEYLNINLNITLKENYQIFPIESRSLNFLGYKFYHNYILLRKSITNRFKQRIKKIKKEQQSLLSVNTINSIMSYYGWMKYANCNNLLNSEIDNQIYYIINNICNKNNLSNPLNKIHSQQFK